MTDPDRWVWPYWLADNWGRFFPARWDMVGYSCMLVVTCARVSVVLSLWSKKELCSRALHDAIVLYMHSQQGSRFNHATIRAQERSAL